MTKKTQQLLLIFTSILLFALVALGLVSCVEKPVEQTYTLTLDVGDGAVLDTTQYQLQEGKSITEFLKTVSLTAKDGFTFVGWYEGGSPIADELKMPASSLTLAAKYSVEYTVKLFRQLADGSYPTNGEVFTGRAIYGESFAYEFSEEHFKLDTSRGSYRTSQLAKGQIFEVYAEREKVTVSYSHNIRGVTPDGDVEWESVCYGATVTLADGADFLLPGYYRFAGWSLSADGEIVYAAGDKLENVQSHVQLYAQWDRAYLDRFGGSDFIFFPQLDSSVAILVRDGLGEKIGSRDGNNFYFEEVGLRGKVSEDGSYAYLKDAQKGVVYTKWNVYSEVTEENVTLLLDGYMNGSCAYTDVDGVEHSFSGTYMLSSTGLYYFSITEGEHVGSYFYFLLSELSESGTPIFVAMGQEALYGSVYYSVADDVYGNYVPYSSYTARFDGFGVVSVAGYGTFYYRPGDKANEFVAYLEGMDVLRMYVIQLDNGAYGWLWYDEEIAGVYRAEDGSTLELDGYGFEAIYTENGQPTVGRWIVDGYSDLQQSYLIKTAQHNFLVNFSKHTFKKIAQSFVELYWLKTEGLGVTLSTDSCMVIYDDGVAELFVNRELAARGNYYILPGGLYRYEQTELLLEGLELPDNMIFKMSAYVDYYGTMESYLVFFLVESTGSDGTVTKYYHSYFDEDGNEVRAYDVGMADYILTSGSVYQAYSYYKGWDGHPFYYDYIMLTFSNGSLYFRIEEDGSLTTLKRLAWSLTLGTPTHDRDGMVILWLDGKDRAYLYPPRNSGRSAMYGSYTVKQIGNAFDPNFVIYTFVAEDDPSYTFDFIFGILDTFEVFIMLDTERTGKFTSDTLGTYELDGFTLNARYIAPNGSVVEGTYYMLGENALRFTERATGKSRDIQLDVETRTFTSSDGYFGEYRGYDGFQFNGEILLLDGKGGAEIGYHDYNDKFVKVAEGSYTIYDDAMGILSVTIHYDDGDVYMRILLLYIDVGYAEYYAYVRSFADGHTYVSAKWEVLALDGFGYATYIDENGVVHRDALYEQVSETEVVFVIGSYAYAVTLSSDSFEITDIYFNPILLAEYGDFNWLYGYENGVLYVSVYQIDEDGTIVAYPTGAINRWGDVLKDVNGNVFDLPPVTDYSVVYYGNGGGLVTLNFEYNGYFCRIEYSINEFISTIYYVTNVSYYWTQTANWTYGDYTVCVYRQVTGSDRSVPAGTVRNFEIFVNGEILPVYSYGKTDGGVDYAIVFDGDNPGYYFVAFTTDSKGVETGIRQVTKWDVHTVSSTDYAEDGTALIATAYYVLSSDGELFDIHVRYTQSNFNGYAYDLTTSSVERFSADTWYVYCIYNYGGSYYTSDFHYIFTYNGKDATVTECQYGYVYSTDDNYIFPVLLDYYDLTVYKFYSFRAFGDILDVVSVERDGDGSYRISTATAVYRVRIVEDKGSIVAEVEIVTAEHLETVQAQCDGVTYTVTYSVELGTDNVISDVVSLAINSDVLVYYSYAKLGKDKFVYVVLDSDYEGYYVINFTLDANGAVLGASIVKYDILTVVYTYAYTLGEEQSSTEFICYYVLDDNGNFVDIIAMTYRIGTSVNVYFFDPYNQCKDIGGGNWWMYFTVDTTYYHFVLTLNQDGQAELMLCYYAPDYGSADSSYTFLLVYDYENNGHIYAIGAMIVSGNLVDIVSSQCNDDGTWTIVTGNATYIVTFTYNSEQETFSASVSVQQ